METSRKFRVEKIESRSEGRNNKSMEMPLVGDFRCLELLLLANLLYQDLVLAGLLHVAILIIMNYEMRTKI